MDWEASYNQRKRDGGRLSAGMKIPLQRPDSPNVRLREWCRENAVLNREPVVRSAPDLNQFNGGNTGAYYPQQHQYEMPSTNNGGYQDVSQAVMNRMPAVAPTPQQQMVPQPSMNNNTAATDVVRLQVGTPIFKALDTNGFTEVTLCRSFGNLPQNWITEYKVVGKRSCYVVNPQEKHIDVARINSNPNSLTTLVELRSPNFLIGTLFVQESYINTLQQQQRFNNNGRSVMNDGYNNNQRFVNPQPQQQHPFGFHNNNGNGNGRILLAG